MAYPIESKRPIMPEPTEQPIDEMKQEQETEEGKVVWVGSEATPNKADDGISDLFAAPDLEEEDEDVGDLVDVDFERDVLDADEDGTLEDLVNVDREDIVGLPPPQRNLRYRVTPSGRRIMRREPPSGMQGIGR